VTNKESNLNVVKYETEYIRHTDTAAAFYIRTAHSEAVACGGLTEEKGTGKRRFDLTNNRSRIIIEQTHNLSNFVYMLFLSIKQGVFKMK
jgi:hypothetical protein